MINEQHNKPLVTIVIPVYNEALNLPILHSRLIPVLDKISQYSFEILIIDNCSEDNSQQIYLEFCAKDSRWKYVHFSRNFGIEASFFAGAEYAQGQALIYLFSDMQDPPELIPEFLEKWHQGNDVVYGILEKRHDHTFVKSMGAYVAYRVLFTLSDIKIPVNATDYRLLSRPVIDSLKRCREQVRYMRGLTHWVGFRQTGIPFTRSPRVHGKSKAGVWWCIKYALQTMVSFSAKPLRVASIVGFLVTGLSVVAGMVYAMNIILIRAGWTTFIPAPPLGWTTLLLAVFFFGGIQCLFLGIVGEYIGQIQKEAKGRPIWIIDQCSIQINNGNEFV